MTHVNLYTRGGLIAASFSTKIWHPVLAQGLLFGAGVGLIVNVTVSIVPQWFVARRSFAVALTTAGSGTGGLIYSLSIQRMIDSLGVSWAFRILAFVSFVVNGSATLFLRDRNHALGSVHKGFNTGLFRRTDFCLFLAWGFFSQFGFGITIFSMSDFAQTMGFTSQQGSYASAAFNCMFLQSPSRNSSQLTLYNSVPSCRATSHRLGQRPLWQTQCCWH